MIKFSEISKKITAFRSKALVSNKRTSLFVWLFYFLVLLFFALVLLAPAFWEGKSNKIYFIDNFFLVVSAISNTGLTVRDVGSELKIVGQVIVFFLMFIGGVGLVYFKVKLFELIRKISQADAQVSFFDNEQQNFERGHVYEKDTKRMLKVSLIVLIMIQLIGAACLFVFFYFFKGPGGINATENLNNHFGKSLWYSFFHSTSATNNSGFDIFKTGTSFSEYSGSYFFQLVIIFQFVLGGIGFPIFLFFWDAIKDLFAKEKKKNLFYWKNIPPFVKFIFFSYFIVFVIGFLTVLTIEKIPVNGAQPKTFMEIVFNTLSTRSAGFSTVNIKDKFLRSSQFIMIVLMWIGTSPLSTGGGIRATAFVLIFLTIFLKKDSQKNMIFRGRSIDNNMFNLAKNISLLSFFLIGIGALIALLDSDQNLETGIFFSTSAIGNVGLNNTESFSGVGNYIFSLKLYAIFLMLVGQIGLNSFFTLKRRERERSSTMRIPIKLIV